MSIMADLARERHRLIELAERVPSSREHMYSS